MPELPEVETIVRDLSRSIEGKRFSAIVVHDAFVLRQEPDDFIKALQNRTITAITRRGKAIIIELSSGEFLVVQLMMTGQMVLGEDKDKHTRISFKFSEGKNLFYRDQRRFGQLRVIKRLDQLNYFNILGPDPFSKAFTSQVMQAAFKKSKRPIKNVLLDHTVVAGIGNIYACEILYRCKINPKRHANKITKIETELICRQIIEVLQEAIAHRGSSMRNYRDAAGEKGQFNLRLAVYAKEDQPCPRCYEPIKRIVQAGRSTFYCGHCQK